MEKEIITIVLDEHSIELEDETKHVIDIIIRQARKLNAEGLKSIEMPLPGTEFLHGLLSEGIISNDLYDHLKRLAEDIEMEYKIKCVPCES